MIKSKQINVLMDGELAFHLHKWAIIESYKKKEMITVSDVIRDAVKKYTEFGKIDLEIKEIEKQ